MSLPVTIIITCYESDRRFLPKAVESAVTQNAREIILVDDGSKELIAPDIQALVHEHGVTLIHKGRNAGLSAARNTGIRLAQTEFILPMDADDWLYPQAVKALVNGIGIGDIATGNITEDRTVVLSSDAVYRAKAPPLQRTVNAGRLLTRAEWEKENQCFATSLFRRRVWESVGGYVELPTPHYEDYHFWSAAFAKGFRFVYVDALIYNHTPRPDSMLNKLHGETEKWHNHAIRGLDLE